MNFLTGGPKAAAYLAQPRRMLIDGAWVESASGQTFEAHNPASGAVLGRAFQGSGEDIGRAVAAARRAFDGPWKRVTPADRARMLWRLADLIEANADELVELEVLNEGMPVRYARMLAGSGIAEACRYYAGWCTKLEGSTMTISIPDMRPGGGFGPPYHAFTAREPVGVIGAIIPWNAPLVMAVAKIAPALAAGCTIVVKPAEETPFTALRLGELALEAGIPPGVINIVPGFGETAGAALVAHRGVDKITFTGSTEIGKIITKAAADNLTKVTLELGGKSPFIVLPDADLDRAIEAAAEAVFLNSGQMCFAGTRLYVHDKVFEKVIEGVVAIAAKMKLGPGLDPTVDMGPLVSAKQQQRVLTYLTDGKAHGGTVVVGGRKGRLPGYFVEPTVVVATDPAARVVREEIFGPVLAALRFTELAEVAAAANDTTYGLAASIWTRDLSAAHGLASEIRAGSVWINCFAMLDESMPTGGYKQSGWGREAGRIGVEEFTEIKSVVAAL